MGNAPILTTAHQTLSNILTDLHEAADRLSSSLALDAPGCPRRPPRRRGCSGHRGERVRPARHLMPGQTEAFPL